MLLTVFETVIFRYLLEREGSPSDRKLGSRFPGNLLAVISHSLQATLDNH